MSVTSAGLTCPHCGGSVSADANVCPGCGAVKKMLGRTSAKPSRKRVLITDLIAVVAGGAIGSGVRFWLFPENSGVGDYVSAAVLGAGICGFIAYKAFGSAEDVKPMVVWERPPTGT